MSTDNGFIKLHRDIRNHWVWKDGDAVKAWIDIIMMANYTDQKIYFSGKLITVKRGTFITSLRKLSERWHWSKDRVLRFLHTLESDGMIDTKRDSKKTTITVINYGFYQDKDKQNATQTRTQTRTQTSPSEESIKKVIKKEEEKASPDLPSKDDDDDDWEDPAESLRRLHNGNL